MSSGEGENRLRRILRQRLESLQRAGVQQLGRASETRAAAWRLNTPTDSGLGPEESPSTAVTLPAHASPLPAPLVEPEEVSSTIAPSRPSSIPAVDRPRPAPSQPAGSPGLAATLRADEPRAAQPDARPQPALPQLDELRREVAACVHCGELARTRKQTVFGVGDPQARLCFFGEAPGADEDRLGEPFVGAAGQLLDKILAACGLDRKQVYILNVLKCRPPGNRTPNAEEVANCRSYFERQLELIQPEFICCLGLVAAQALLRTTSAVSKLRGRFHDYRGSRVIVTYHPAYLLRAPDAKRHTWDDMKMLMREMGIEIPPRSG